MALNYVWVFFFIGGCLLALSKLIFYGDVNVIPNAVNGTFDSSKTAFEIALGLTGVMCFWLGLLRVGEKAGFIEFLAKIIGPFFSKIFPDIPKNHPALGNILMNFSANMLGLDNAATPLGLKAMRDMQEINPDKNSASNPQIMFMALNTAGFTIIPVTIMLYRKQAGAANPADVLIPLIICTYLSTLTGLIVTAIYQKINLFQPIILAYLFSLVAFIVSVTWFFSRLNAHDSERVSKVMSGILLMLIICGFIAVAAFKKINVYDNFIEGAKEGFDVAVKIIPYLVAMLVAIGFFRACGGMEMLTEGIKNVLHFLHLPTFYVEALPTGIMKPFSGSGARGLMIDCMKTYGADSLVGRISCLFQGSHDTTFYMLSLYFGSVGIRNTRYTLVPALLSDLMSIVASIIIGSIFFG